MLYKTIHNLFRYPEHSEGSKDRSTPRRSLAVLEMTWWGFCLCLLTLSMPSFASMDNTQMAVWANEAIVATYTYNAQNLLSRQKEIAYYFTANGWISYTKALTDSKILEAVKKNNYEVSAVATLPPQIKLIQNNNWEAEMPLLVVYKNPQYQQKQHLMITLQFTTIPSGQGIRGLAITSLQAKPVTPFCECPVGK